MRWFLEHETARYSLKSDRHDFFLLHRRSDGAECYFQGDDANLWRNNIDALVSIELKSGWNAGNSLSAAFDFLCSGYDDVLTKP